MLCISGRERCMYWMYLRGVSNLAYLCQFDCDFQNGLNLCACFVGVSICSCLIRVVMPGVLV